MSYLHFDLCTGGQTFSTAFVDKSTTIWKESKTPGDINTQQTDPPDWFSIATASGRLPVKSLTRENVTSWNYRLQPSSRKQACDVIWRRRSKSRCDFWLIKTRNLKLLGQEAERLQNYKWKHLLSICRSKSQIRHKWYVFTYTEIYIYL